MYSDQTRAERTAIIDAITERTGCTRRHAARRHTWVHPWVNGTRSVAVGRTIPAHRGGGFAVDFEITLYWRSEYAISS